MRPSILAGDAERPLCPRARGLGRCLVGLPRPARRYPGARRRRPGAGRRRRRRLGVTTSPGSDSGAAAGVQAGPQDLRRAGRPRDACALAVPGDRGQEHGRA